MAPNSPGHTASASVLLYLLTGKDANALIATEDPKISEAKKKAVIGYIQVKGLTARREKLEAALLSSNITDPRTSVERIRKEISDLQTQMDAATKESQQIMSEIHVWNGKLSESKTIEHNLSILH